MKKLINQIVVLSLVLLVLPSCEKTNPRSGIEDGNNVRLKVSDVVPSNSSNDYDYIGDSHNDQLIEFVDSIKNSTTSDLSLVYNHFYVQGIPSWTNVKKAIDEANFDPEDYTGVMDSLYEIHNNLFVHYLYVRDIVNDSTTLQEKVNAIKAYENSINYSNYTSNETMALKATFSIARYSMVLWASSDEGGLDYNNNGNITKSYIGGNKKTHSIVMSDIAGCYTGALLTWNPAAALGGGVLSSGWTWLFYYD